MKKVKLSYLSQAEHGATVLPESGEHGVTALHESCEHGVTVLPEAG